MFTVAPLVVSAGLIYVLLLQHKWWVSSVNKTSVAIENRTDDSVDIVGVSVDGARRDINQRLEPGEFTMLLGFYTKFALGGHQEFELVFTLGAGHAAQTFRYRAAKDARQGECDVKFVIGPDGMKPTRSCPFQPPFFS